MSVRNRNGRLEWRFTIDGHEYSKLTEMRDTPRNRTAVSLLEAEARRLVLDGQTIRLRIQPFDAAVAAFLRWADGEYVAHPATSARIRGSMMSALTFFEKRPLGGIGKGTLEDYKAWRRTTIKDITLRHDLHALSLLFQYGQSHNWCRGNPAREVDIPSDDVTRSNVLSPADEARWFAAIDALMGERLARGRSHQVATLQDIRDLSTLMLNQGCRPEELRELPQSCVDLEKGMMAILKGKSTAARRVLPLTLASRDVMARRLQRPGAWVFPRADGRHIGQAQRWVEAATKRAGLKGFCLYTCRHSFATRSIERGVKLPELMAILGHSNLRSIMKYVHFSFPHVCNGMRVFEAGAPITATDSAVVN